MSDPSAIDRVITVVGRAIETVSTGFPLLWEGIVSLTILVVGLTLLGAIRRLVCRRTDHWTADASPVISSFVTQALSTLFPLLYFGIFYLSLSGLPLPPTAGHILNALGMAVVTFLIIRFAASTAEYLIREGWAREGEQYLFQGSRIKALIPVSKVIIWGIGVIFLLDNLGFRISSVLAGLGIGGVAVALASQTILGDLFNYFVILFDRPFEIGDFIVIDGYLGSIEHIGIKTTRLRSLSGEQLIFSNTDLCGARVRNYKRMLRRRVAFQIGVTYDTPADRLREIPDQIRTIITGIDGTLFDRAHFSAFGEFSLVFDVVYYVLGSDFNQYMDIQQTINLGIKAELETAGVAFAFPTRTLHFADAPEFQPSSVVQKTI